MDTYNTYALDYVNQQGPLREGYVDWRVTDSVAARFEPLHPSDRLRAARGELVDREGSHRIRRLNAEAELWRDGWLRTSWCGQRSSSQMAAMGVLGDGNRQNDYDWFTSPMRRSTPTVR